MADVSTEDLDAVGTPATAPPGLSAAAEEAAAGARDLARGRERILGELRRVIVGQDEAIDLVLTALFTGGHCLITGVPGLAKTRLIKALADILALESRDGDGAAAHEAVSVARGITQQAQVLEQELSRFLAMRPDSQG